MKVSIYLAEPFYKRREFDSFDIKFNFDVSRYLIVDYERQNFSIYQNVWNPRAVQQIVSIDGVTAPETKKSHPVVEIVGLVISMISICSLLIGLMLEFYFKKRVRMTMKGEANKAADFLDLYNRKSELDARGRAQGELQANEVEADGRDRLEMPAGVLSEVGGEAGISELRGTDGGVEKD